MPPYDSKKTETTSDGNSIVIEEMIKLRAENDQLKNRLNG